MRRSAVIVVSTSALLVVLTALAAVSSPEAARQRLSPLGVHFARAAAQSDLFELGSAQLALGRADGEPAVRELATMLRRDHQRSSRQLKTLARGVKLPTRPSPLESYVLAGLAEQTAEDGDTGSTFAQRFGGAQVAAHEQAIQLFTEEARLGSDPGLKAFARRTLPALRRHLAHAKELARGDG